MIRFLKLPALPVVLACALLQLPVTVRAVPSNNVAPVFNDPLVATGKGFEIKRSQVDDAFVNYSASAAASGSAVPDAQRATIRAKLLDHLIVNSILLQKATEADKSSILKIVDEYLARARAKAGSDQAFDVQIKATGMTLAEVRNKMQEERVCQLVLVRETTNGIVIPEADVKKFFTDNPDKFKVPERVRAAHILVATQDPISHQSISPAEKKDKLKLATELKARAEKGEDFAALVKKYSDDPGSKDTGGEYTFKRGQMVLEFEDAAFSMKTNQISDPVETQFGYHIIKLLEKLPASNVDYVKAEPDIRDFLTEQAAEKALPAYIEKLKAGADVKILDQGGAASTPAPVK
jgi:peptidyl-prolyl cis-trans isomerase C